MSDNEDNRSRDGDGSLKDGVDEAVEQAIPDPDPEGSFGIRDSDENWGDTSTQGDGMKVTSLGAGYSSLFRSWNLEVPHMPLT